MSKWSRYTRLRLEAKYELKLGTGWFLFLMFFWHWRISWSKLESIRNLYCRQNVVISGKLIQKLQKYVIFITTWQIVVFLSFGYKDIYILPFHSSPAFPAHCRNSNNQNSERLPILWGPIIGTLTPIMPSIAI